MSDRSKTALTHAQAFELRALRILGALHREAAVDVYALQAAGAGNPNVIGILRDKGWADSRARRAAGAGWTDYWLTDAGVAKANEVIVRGLFENGLWHGEQDRARRASPRYDRRAAEGAQS